MGKDYKYEIGLWWAASEILFFPIIFWFLVENDKWKTCDESGVLGLGESTQMK